VSAPEPFAGIEEELRILVRGCCDRDVVHVERLSGSGLAHRRFYRVQLGSGEPRTLIARVDRGEPAPGVPAEPPLEATRAFLEAHGLPVPRRFGGDAARAIELIEDFGDDALADVADRSDTATRRALYQEAGDLIPRLQRLADPSGRVPAFGRHLDAALFRLKATRFARSGLPAVLGRAASDIERDVVFAAFDAVAEEAARAPQRFAHRDFQSKNLIVRAGAAAGKRIAMIDLQGAFLAPPEYDLVCLLRDSYVEWPDVQGFAGRAGRNYDRFAGK
jgi:aminoglycoside phosphotransferase (APT) family kinase protein